MKHKKSLGLVFILKNLLQAYLKRLSDLSHLAGLEAKLAGRTIITLTLLSIILVFIVLSTWLSLLLLVFIFLVSLHYTLLFASLVITGLNFFLLIILYFSMVRIKKNLYFPATRRQLANMNLISKD